MTRTLDELKQIIVNERANKAAWRAIASKYDVNVAVIWRIMNEGYEPKDNEIRKRLGLSIVVVQHKDPISGRYVKG
jgi:DNA invertase Pin-like site-specific DNA recombinase